MISLIVAVAEKGVIGKNGTIPWRLPGELAYFKQTTMGHPIIMGRKTHEVSIGRALPGRTNIVITRQKDYKPEGCVVAESLDQAIEIAKKAPGADEIFVIGGQSIYEQALPVADRIYLTEVQADIDGDKFFRFDRSDWQETARDEYQADAKNKYDFDILTLEKRN